MPIYNFYDIVTNRKDQAMSTVLTTVSEARQKRRYFIAKTVSRGGDLFISWRIEAVYGGSWAWYLTALAVGGVFNVVTDYLLQKFWVSGPLTEETGFSWKETGRYTTVRVYYIPLSLAAHALLYQFLGVHFVLTSITVSVGLWVITYRNTRGIFTSRSTRWIPWPLRSSVIRRRKAKKGSAR